MGNNLNGKRDEQKKTYYQQQINLFKWRADPKHNTFLPRVYFCKKSQQMQRQRFNKIVLKRLDEDLFIDTQDISQLIIEDQRHSINGEIIVFEKYSSSLAFFNQSLNLEECLYVLNSMIDGYQRIFNKIGKTHIQNEFCFVTMQGQVRAWINENPASNEFPRQQILFNGFNNQFKQIKKFVMFNGEASMIKKIIDLNYKLSNGSKEYIHFYNKIKEYINGNILHHTNFNAVKKFINKYLFNFRVILPFNLLGALERLKIKKNREENISNHNSNSYDKSHQQFNITSVQLSTNANIQYSKQPYQKILQEQQQSQKQKNFKEDVQLNDKYFLGCQTPKTNKSTFMHSQIIQSRYQKENMHTVSFAPRSKLLQKNKTSNNLKDGQNISKFHKRSQKQINSKSAKVSVKFHSRQPSMEQQTNSMFLSPASELIDYGVHYSYDPQSKQKPTNLNNAESIMSIYRAQQNKCMSKDQEAKSHILERQVSGLVSNKSMSICQSIGTFQSIENMKDSGYKGILLKMGKTAKILNQPTAKNFNTSLKADPYMTN